MTKANTPADMKTGVTHKTKNYGVLEIISYNGWDRVSVIFRKTKYKTTANTDNIRNGRVKDNLLPSVYGVGFIGDGKHKTKQKDSDKYQAWRNMLTRCYCPKYQEKSPTYKDATVCNNWLNYQNFASWFDLNYSNGLHLDKDVMQKGINRKVYSPKTCRFISCAKNSIEANAKWFEFASPKGINTIAYNLSEFCRVHGLHVGAMSGVHSGKLRQHKGWIKVIK